MSNPDFPDQSETLPEETRSVSSRRKFLFTILGLAIFLALVHFGGVENLSKLARPNIPLLLLAAGAIAAMLFVFSYRWGVIANSLAEKSVASVFQYYLYSVSSLALGIFVPQTASVFVARAAALKRNGGMSLPKGFASVFIDKLFDLLLMLIFIAPALLLLPGIITLSRTIWLSATLLMIVSILITWRYQTILRAGQQIISIGLAIAERLPLIRRITRMKATEHLRQLSNRETLQKATGLRAYWLTVLGQGLLVLRAWLIAQAFGLDISIAAIFVGIALVQGSLLLAITPGGLGTSEVAWFIALTAADVPVDTITAFLVAHRVYQSLVIALLWLLLYLSNLLKGDRMAISGNPLHG